MDDNLNEIFTQCWGSLFYGSVMESSAFRTGVFGTQFNGVVNLRTVVLRSAAPDEKQITFYTDGRSAKMNDLRSAAAVSWLFYDAAEKVQIRVSGIAIIHYKNEVTRLHWEKVSDEGRKSYMAMPAPSSDVDHPTDGLDHLKGGNQIDKESGYQNFAVVTTQVDYIEWLKLKREGHRRAEFKMMDGSWKGQWLIP